MNTTVDALDLERLAEHLGDRFGTLESAEKFSGGQSNPTFRLVTSEGEFVLRRQPPGKLLKSAHAVDREYRVMRALADTPVPVPEVYVLEREAGINAFAAGYSASDSAIADFDGDGRDDVLVIQADAQVLFSTGGGGLSGVRRLRRRGVRF